MAKREATHVIIRTWLFPGDRQVDNMDWLSESINFLVVNAVAPFLYVARLDQRIYWLYLFVALLLAAWIFIHKDSEKKSVRPITSLHRLKEFGSFCFPKEVYGHTSAKIDYLFFIINRIAFPWLIAPLIVGVPIVSHISKLFFTQFSFLIGLMGHAGLADKIFFTLCSLIIMDAAFYVSHYLQHHVPFLWEFHKVHHSAEVLTPITVYRMHPVDDLLTGSLASIAIGFLTGLFQILYSEGLGLFTVAGLNIGLFAFYVFGYNLRHSHIWLPYHPVVSHIFISPAQHQMHHSINPRHFNRNLGFVFAFWDWIARTLYVPMQREEIVFGIVDKDSRDYSSVHRLYWRPFVRAYKHLPRINQKKQK